MGKKEQIIFFDIDGTLLHTNEEKIRQEIIDKIAEMKEQGFKIALATGRSLGQAKSIMNQLKISDGVFANGQMVIFNHEIIYNYTIPEQHSKKVFDDAKKYQVFPAPINQKGMHLNPGLKNLILLYKLRSYSFGGIKLARTSIKGNQGFWYFGKPKDIKAVLPQIDTEYFNVYPYGDTTLEIMPKKFNKALGIDLIIKEHPEAKTYAFGDGRNDFEMISHVNVGIAMGNANDKLKEAAFYVTDTNDNGGIIKGLNKILKQEL